MRPKHSCSIFVIVCALGAPPPLMAEPVQETSATYERLFSHDPEYQPRREPFFAFEVGAQAGIGSDVRYRFFIMSRFLYAVGLGLAVNSGGDSTTGILPLAQLWLLEINDYGLYIPMGIKGEESFSGAGLSFPLGKHANLRLEANAYVEVEKWLFTAGVTYRLL